MLEMGGLTERSLLALRLLTHPGSKVWHTTVLLSVQFGGPSGAERERSFSQGLVVGGRLGARLPLHHMGGLQPPSAWLSSSSAALLRRLIAQLEA